MKKNRRLYKSLSALLILSSVAFTAVAQDAPEPAATTEAETKAAETSDSAADNKSKSKKAKKEKAPKAPKQKKQKEPKVKEAKPKDPELTAPEEPAAKKVPNRSINETFGKIRLRVNAKFGSYTLGVINASEKTVNLLSTANEFTTNGFYLKAGHKIYSLNTDNAVKATVAKGGDGAVIRYNIPNQAEVAVAFDFFASEKDNPADMVKVTATVTNKSKKNDEFSLKAILDTVLGESGSYHFITSDGIPVKNEVLYRTLQYQKYFLSINDAAALQMFFTGADCTEPDYVGLANFSTFSKPGWEPGMTVVRAFDTIYSYNNSAVCAVWKPVSLPPEKSFKVVYYLAVAADGIKPNGEKFINKDEKAGESSEAAAAAYEKVKDYPIASGAVEPVKPAEPVETIKPATPEEPVRVVETSPAPAETKTREVPAVDFNIKNMTQEKLSPEYIQSLLDRIAALEEDSPSLNRQELLQLNAELDAILTYLRQ